MNLKTLEMKVILVQIIILIASVNLLSSCKKDFLDKKPDKALLVPTTLTDFQALLDNSDALMNYVPGLQEVGSDDFYTTNNGWLGLSTVIEKNSYLWKADLLEGNADNGWTYPYQQVFYANVVLDGLKGIKTNSSNISNWNAIKGSALFYRALAFYELAQLYSPPYQPATATQEPGIPLRLSSDVNIKSVRGTLQQTYDQIASDLRTAEGLLPLTVAFKTRPCKAAALGLLARVSQTMQKYDQSLLYATECLQLSNTLIDYNTLNTSATRSFPVALPNGNNPEIIFYTVLLGYSYNKSALTSVDSTLYRSYNTNDLRKVLFFKDRGSGIFTFKGSYAGTSQLFGGLATDEIYLIRAESYARLGNITDAMDDLNTLLNKRYRTGYFASLSAATPEEALGLIITERRKELVDRGLRWTDLRRLNLDTRFAVTLNRVINGQHYTLAANDNRYVFPIPNNELLESGIQQNPR
jgi:hypothetical protein